MGVDDMMGGGGGRYRPEKARVGGKGVREGESGKGEREGPDTARRRQARGSRKRTCRLNRWKLTGMGESRWTESRINEAVSVRDETPGGCGNKRRSWKEVRHVMLSHIT